uniref:Uncharacterized protein n=1 Tax=Cucumis melo TaxID=3656 RepID=A0A9I9EIJ3_CUCME
MQDFLMLQMIHNKSLIYIIIMRGTWRSMYDLPIVPPPVHRGRVRVEEAKLDEVYHNVEEVPPANTEPNWLW